MPSPAYVYRDLFTADELRAMIVDLATNGRFTSLSGGAKSSTRDYLPFAQQLIELRAELDRLNGVTAANRIEQRLFKTGELTGNISIP